MKTNLKYILVLTAVGATCLFSADVSKPKPQIVLLRTYVSTNTIPGYTSGPDAKPAVDANGFVPAVAVIHPPRTEIVTNYVLGYFEGTNAVELLIAQKR